MLRVMIVDDEYMLLRGLPKLIDWQDLGLTIVKTFQNPLLALKYLENQPVDILLSDMNMPELDGPDFVAKAKKLQPDMELIVISGYEDFDYVRAGLQQHAVNYLRKPIDEDELTSTLQAAEKRIAERKEGDHNASWASQAELRNLLIDNDKTARARLSATLAISFNDAANPVRLLAVMNPVPPQDLVNFLQQAPAVHGFFREGQDFMILFQGDSQTLSAFVQKLPASVNATRRPVLIGPAANSAEQLAGDYRRIQSEISRQYFFETSAGLRELTRDQPEPSLTLMGYSRVKEAIKGLEPAAFRHWLVQQTQSFVEANVEVTFAKQFALIVLLVLSEQLPSDEQKKSDTIAAINQAQTVTKLISTLVDLAQRVALQERHQYSRNVLEMREIVHNKYAQPLTLNSVAAELHLNAVYLGQQFKLETGRTFSQYLNDWRMGLTIDLLKNSEEDVNQIALSVGYQTPSYFFKLFKQQTGMSPREYRAAAGNDRA